MVTFEPLSSIITICINGGVISCIRTNVIRERYAIQSLLLPAMSRNDLSPQSSDQSSSLKITNASQWLFKFCFCKGSGLKNSEYI